MNDPTLEIIPLFVPICARNLSNGTIFTYIHILREYTNCISPPRAFFPQTVPVTETMDLNAIKTIRQPNSVIMRDKKLTW